MSNGKTLPSTMALLERLNWYLPPVLGWIPDVRVEAGPVDRMELCQNALTG